MSTYVRFYSLMAVMLGAIFVIEREVGAVWSGDYGSDLSPFVAAAVVITALIVARRKRPDVAWLYPDAPEAWATTRPTTAAAIFALLILVVALVAALARGSSFLDGFELAAFLGAVAFVLVLVMEWISHSRRRTG